MSLKNYGDANDPTTRGDSSCAFEAEQAARKLNLYATISPVGEWNSQQPIANSTYVEWELKIISSHEQATTQAKDEIKNRICADAKIPLLRFRIGDKWNADTIRTQFEQVTGFKKDGISTDSPQRSTS